MEGSLVDHRQDHKEVACTTGMRIVRMAIMFKPMVMFMFILVTERGKMMMMRASD